MRTILAAVLVASPVLALAAEPDSEPKTAESDPWTHAFDVAVDKPGGLAFDGELLWVADRVAQKIRGLDPKTGRERASIESPGPRPSGLAFDGELLWVADRSRALLFGIDLERQLVVREVPSPADPQGLAFDGEHLWVADGTKLHRVTTEDGTTISSFDAPTWAGDGRPTEELGLAFADGWLWVSDRQRDALFRVLPDTGEVVDQLPTPGPFPAGLAAVGDRLLVVDVDRRSVDALAFRALPRIVRSNPRHETVVLRRRITNQGPGALAEANVYVALPRPAPNQALEGEPVLDPKPKEITADQWGQRVAVFRAQDLKPGESLEVSMTVRATLFDMHYHLDPGRVGSLRDIPADVRKQYLADASKFAITDPIIRKHVAAALGDEKRPYWMIRRIARYIQDRMRYELAGGWNIAPTVIERGTGSCSEYTFVFIAMCRAAGIPARYVGSVVVRGDDASTDDVYHRWPEVYLPGYGWVPWDAQAGDKPAPEAQAKAIGDLPNRMLITTSGGGASRLMGWEYNSFATWTCRGRCLVQDQSLGDWYPADRGPKPTP